MCDINPKFIDPKDVYEAYRLKVLGENNLINHRMTWFVVLQSLLFTSIAIASKSDLSSNGTQFIYVGAAVIGMTFSALAYFSIDSALQAIMKTKKRWEDEFVNAEDENNPYKQLPALTGGEIGDELSWSGRLMPRFVPISVGLVWVVVLLVTLVSCTR